MSSYRAKLIFCFACIYIIWGSTYLAILYGIETIPPWALSAIRFFIAAVIMWGISFFKKEQPLTPVERKNAIITGALLILANGLVCVVEQWVSSSLAAVVIGAMPIWMMLVGWVGFKMEAPSALKWIGAVIGLSGVILIALGDPGATDTSSGSSSYFYLSIFLLIISNLTWATGTLIQRRIINLKSPLLFSRTQMFSGFIATLIFSLALESPWQKDWTQVSAVSWWATLYLATFGSVVAYTAYGWLARNVEPHKISTYALVNPVIAVFLGWFYKNEKISGQFLSATILILVGLYILFRKKPIRP